MPTLVPVDYDPFAAEEYGNETLAQMAAKVIGGMARQAWDTPKQALGASEDLRTTGDYDPAPVVNAALMGMTGGVAGVPMEAGEAALGAGPIRAYHGSPYDFDQFDLSKIGTGEGAQAYGSGLYFAENPSVAAEYKKNLSARFSPASLTDQVRQLEVGGKPNPFDIDQMPEFVQMASANDQEGLKQFTRDRLSRWQELTQDKTYPFPDYAKQKVAAYQGLSNALESGQAMTTPRPIQGRMYEVNIAADPEHFLDWDKPLSEQSEHVKTALGNTPWGLEYVGSRNLTGGQIAPSSAEGVKQLRDLGIPGIKYLDQGSRIDPVRVQQAEAGLAKVANSADPVDQLAADHYRAEIERLNGIKQTSNYVVFDPSIINIIKKYGLAGLIAGGAAHFALSPVDHDPFAEGADQ